MCTMATLGTCKKWPFYRGALIKVRLKLAVTELNWPLLTGGRCSEVAVSSGLNVLSAFPSSVVLKPAQAGLTLIESNAT